MTDTPLMLYVLSVLSPLLMLAGLTEDIAREAAREAIAAHTGPLLTAAKIAGLGMAMLDDLRLSADPDMPIPLKLKLRGNAAALNRAERETAAMERPAPATDSSPPPDDHELLEAARDLVRGEAASRCSPVEPLPRRWPDETTPLRDFADEPAPGARSVAFSPAESARQPGAEDPYPEMWANAMIEVAAELTAGLDKLGPAERAADVMRVALLTETANKIRGT